MKIDYSVLDPSGNITALVTTKVKPELYTEVSKFIMNSQKNVEQVGFVDFNSDIVKLNMSGSEFCGNAIMAAAVLKNRNSKTACKIGVKIMPFGDVLSVHIKKDGEYYECDCVFKVNSSRENIYFEFDERSYEFTLVKMPGIYHIIADNSLSEKAAAGVIKELTRKLDAPALGIMLYDREKSFLRPLVYVKETNTLFFENSCVSGSCALAYALFCENEQRTINQPGGTVITAKNENGIRIKEKIRITESCCEEM